MWGWCCPGGGVGAHSALSGGPGAQCVSTVQVRFSAALHPDQQGQGSPVLIPSSPSRSASNARKEASASQLAEAAALETQRVCLSAWRLRSVNAKFLSQAVSFPGSPTAFRTVSALRLKLHLSPGSQA